MSRPTKAREFHFTEKAAISATQPVTLEYAKQVNPGRKLVWYQYLTIFDFFPAVTAEVKTTLALKVPFVFDEIIVDGYLSTIVPTPAAPPSNADQQIAAAYNYNGFSTDVEIVGFSPQKVFIVIGKYNNSSELRRIMIPNYDHNVGQTSSIQVIISSDEILALNTALGITTIGADIQLRFTFYRYE